MVKSGKFADYHPGSFGKIPARATVFGVLFAAAFTALGWIGLPDFRWLWIASGIGGIIIGVSLYFWHKRSKLEIEELSIRPPR